MNRPSNISSLETETFDLCIIGGGATGAGCALDAALRGLKVVLIEKEDFASATSSKSTKLIHGGVRYLEQAVKKLSWAQFVMVKKALKERRTLLQIAPHLTHPLALMTPCFTLLEGWYYAIGLKLYDWISGTRNIGNSQWLSKPLALKRIPTLKKNKLASAVLYWDGQLDDLRFAMALIQTASKHGAVVINHMPAEVFEKNDAGQLIALQVTDTLTGNRHRIKTKQFVNATGPFADSIRLMANPTTHNRIRVSKGIHLTLPKEVMPGDTAMLIPKTDDGRLIFVIPYQNELLVGTTDDECALTDEEFGPDKNEIAYLLGYVNRYLDVNLSSSDVRSGFGGLRPLLQAAPGASTKELVRDHEVEIDESTGLISILGGKWTTYRLMAKDTIDAVEEQLNRQISTCKTDTELLFGGTVFKPEHYLAVLAKDTKWDEEILWHLLQKYGCEATSIAVLAAKDLSLAQRILPGMPYTFAELKYLLENEMACTVKDVVARRWGLALTNWDKTVAIIPVIGKVMTTHFQWTEMEQQLYIDVYKAEVETMIRLAKG
ncbi:MAG: glycerol-3-phosphate dehydrogenase/oxidase [Chitinophagaceae bacterium]